MKAKARVIEEFFVFTIPTGWFFLFLPLDLYHRNRDDWGVPVGEFLTYGLGLALLTASLLACLSLALGEKGRVHLKTILYFFFSVAFLHTFLPVAAEERELTGILLDFHFPLSVHLLSLLAIGAAGFVMFRFRQRLFATFSSNYVWLSTLLLLASLTLAWVSSSTAEGALHRTAGKLESAQLQELYTLSSRRNVLLLILDTVPADIALEVMDNQDLAQRFLKDFVFYKNNLSIAPQTYMSMANLHIGSFWRESVDEHLQASPGKVRDQSFVNLLVDAGWQVAMAGRGPCPQKLAICGSTNTQNIGFGQRFGFSEPFIQAMNIALFKTSPILLKRWVYNDEEFLFKSVDFLRLRSTSASTSTLHIPRFDSEAQRDNYFLTFLADHGIVGDTAPRFKLFHLMSTHPRFYFDATCKKGPVTDDRDSMKNHVKCAFAVIAHVVNQLQRKGVYDATTIIVAGDHGINYPSAFVPYRPINSRIENFAQVVTQANALLMIKRENAHLPRLTVSELPTSTADITRTICDTARLDCRGRYPDSLSLVDDAHIPLDRLRLYAHHGFGAENAERYGVDLYAVQGKLWDVVSWRYVAHLPGKGGGSGNAAREQLDAFEGTEHEELN